MKSNDLQAAMMAFLNQNPDLQPGDDMPDETNNITTDNTKRNFRLDIVFEKKGRGGKQATIICGFEGSDDELQELASVLKRRLATGGSARGGEILIQGDRRQDVLKLLKELNYKARII